MTFTRERDLIIELESSRSARREETPLAFLITAWNDARFDNEIRD